MSEPTMDRFERSLAAGLEAYVAGAFDPKPIAAIADAAMRPRGVVSRARNLTRSRRLLLFSVAAVLLVPAAYIGARALLPTEPRPINQVQPPIPTVVPTFVADATPQPTPVPDEWRAVVVRWSPDDSGSVSISAVRPDGQERLLREVPASILPDGHLFSEWGSVSRTGWIALADQQSPWNMVLVDLRDPQAEPWLVPQTSIGGIGPAWSPQGLVAAPSGEGVAIFDPETRSRVGQVAGGMIGGGPTIIWTEDGTGIVEQQGQGGYGVLPIDGGLLEPGFPEIYGSRGGYGDLGATLRVCSPGGECSLDDGHVELVDVYGSATTIYEQIGDDRPTAAMFDEAQGEYLIQLDADAGRQIAIDRVSGNETERIRSFGLPESWRYFGMTGISADDALLTFFVDLGNNTFGMAIAPDNGGVPTYHDASFAGFLASSITDSAGTASYSSAGSEPIGPPSDTPYPLASIEDLIAAEVELNPGHTPVGQASHDAVEGDSDIEEYVITAEGAGDLEAYVDCFGATEITVSHKTESVTNPCVSPGSYIGNFVGMVAGDEVVVSASHDTTWRVVLYAYIQSPGDTPPPEVEPVQN